MNPQVAPTPAANPAAPVAAAQAGQAPFQGANIPQAPAVPSYDPAAAVANIAKYYQIPGQTAGIVGQQTANSFNAQTSYENSLREASLQEQKLKDKLNPSAYTIQQDKNDGHTVILDSTGQPTDIGTYINRTGANPVEVMKNSNNPQEVQFKNDYQNYQTLLQNTQQAKYDAQGNPANEAAQIVKDYTEANPTLANVPAAQIRNLFMQKYGNYFGLPQAQPAPSTGYTPAINPQIAQYLYERNLLSQGVGQGLPTGIPSDNSAGASSLPLPSYNQPSGQ